MTQSNILDIVRQTIEKFCREFIANPYLCYTEHGQHARFYAMLYNAIPEDQRYVTWEGQKVCVLQKEYPTADKLGKPRRQHWDLAILANPPESAKHGAANSYDYLKLAAVIEFGMNEPCEHLEEDIRRLAHEDANLDQGFIVHLYRLSKPGALFSDRDWSPNTDQILDVESKDKDNDLKRLSLGKPAEVYYAITDSTGTKADGIWKIIDGDVSVLK
ncbi:MAG: hypothetical protein FJ135_09425 [Deltaproteobacteria bacterium]|nr:hypothetical protein [Deltaproteobacteria bacterium]